MNHYELLAILNGKFSDAENLAPTKILEETVAKHGGVIHYTQNLERRKLAFPIKHQVYGTYILIEFDCEGKSVVPLNHELRLSKDLLRHTIVRRKTVGKPKVLLQEKRETSRALPSKDIDALITPLLSQDDTASEQHVLEQPTPSTAIPTPSDTHDVQEKIIAPLPEKPKEAEETEQQTKEKKKKTTKSKSLDERLDEILHDNLL